MVSMPRFCRVGFLDILAASLSLSLSLGFFYCCYMLRPARRFQETISIRTDFSLTQPVSPDPLRYGDSQATKPSSFLQSFCLNTLLPPTCAAFRSLPGGPLKLRYGDSQATKPFSLLQSFCLHGHSPHTSAAFRSLPLEAL